MFSKKTVHDIDVSNKRIFLRVDYNVPIKDGQIQDDYRIRQSLDTIYFLLERGAKLFIYSHLGRPESADDKSCSLEPISKRLAQLLNREVVFASDCIGKKTKELVSSRQDAQVFLLENVRYHKEEEENSEQFAKSLVDTVGAEVFVQDCFGVAHRAHASIVGVAKLLPAVSGFLLEKEVNTITDVMQSPERPLLAIIGGAKISDKIEILHKFIEVADAVAIVGAMANTFLLAEGVKVGKSLVEQDSVETAKEILEKARQKAKETPFTFFIPKDVVVSKSIDGSSATRVIDLSHHNWADINAYPRTPQRDSFEIGDDELILDIGPFSAAYIAGLASLSKTAVWNGTAGVTETVGISGAAAPFAHGTRIIVDALVGEISGAKNKPFTVVGGGDTVSYVESNDGLKERFNHVSTGGGASLELMAGKVLPGVDVLWNKD